MRDYLLFKKGVPFKLKKIVKEWDDLGKVDYTIDSYLEELFLTEGMITGIHRTANLNDADKIMTEGLRLSGHTSSGVEINLNEYDVLDLLGFNVSFTDKNSSLAVPLFFRDIKTACYYKNYTGTNISYVMVIQIPEDVRDYQTLTYMKDGFIYLKPEYIKAKIEVNDGNVLNSVNTVINEIDEENGLKM